MVLLDLSIVLEETPRISCLSLVWSYRWCNQVKCVIHS